jgi:hypothetical protein
VSYQYVDAMGSYNAHVGDLHHGPVESAIQTLPAPPGGKDTSTSRPRSKVTLRVMLKGRTGGASAHRAKARLKCILPLEQLRRIAADFQTQANHPSPHPNSHLEGLDLPAQGLMCAAVLVHVASNLPFMALLCLLCLMCPNPNGLLNPNACSSTDRSCGDADGQGTERRA